ncbi:MAG: hypothetical protein MUQ26_08360, partial [Armatimonadetes bacterium]|nr:hypothetical protein [Armatimonadota bacterium]
VRSREEDGAAYWAIPEEWLPNLRPEKLSRRAARRRIFLRALRVAGPIAVEDLSRRYGLTQKATTAALRGLLETGEVQQGSFVRGRATPQVCATANLEELHRRALAALRREVEPVGLGRYVDFLLKWQHAHPKSKLEGAEGIRTVMAQQAGHRAYPRVWEREIIGLRVRDAARRGIVSAVSSGDVRAGQFNLGETRSRPLLAATTFVPDERAAQFLEVPSTENCSADEISVLRLLRKQGDTPAAQIASGTGLAETDVEQILWHLFRSGLVSNTDYSAIARCGWTSAPRWESALFGGADASEEDAAPDSGSDTDGDDADLRRAGLRAAQGDWYAAQSIADLSQDDDALSRRRRARVMALMQRYGVAAREVLLAKSDMSTQDVSRGLRELFLRGQLLRGFFVRSLSGDQFALPDALEGLRKEAPAKSEPALMVSSIDPAAVHLTAVKLPGMQNRPLATRYLVLHRGELEAIVDRHAGEGRFLRVRDLRLFHPGGASRPQRTALHKRVATAILEYAIRWGAWEAVRVSHVNGDSVYEQTEFAGDLAEAGFRLVRDELSYRLRKRVGAAAETAMRRIVKTEEQRREDVRLTS